MNIGRRSLLVVVAGVAGGAVAQMGAAEAASARQIDQNANEALQKLYAVQPKARELARRAKGILIFPKIVKAGLMFGGMTGEGALKVGGKTAGYYNISAVSYGFQAGVQTYSYVLFFMTDAALKYLVDSDGWAIGAGPSVVIMDKGSAASMTSTTMTQDVYAFPFGQRGMMAGAGLEGSKITHIHPGG